MSFDVLKDGDGDGRQQFPLSMLLCAGTQADTALKNRYGPPQQAPRACAETVFQSFLNLTLSVLILEIIDIIYMISMLEIKTS